MFCELAAVAGRAVLQGRNRAKRRLQRQKRQGADQEARGTARLPWLWEYKRKDRKIPKKEREKEKRRDFMTY